MIRQFGRVWFSAAILSLLFSCAAAYAQTAPDAATPVAAGVTVSFTNTPLSNVVATLDREYGVHIVLEGGLRPYQKVTFSADGVDAGSGRLLLVNQLANALDADWQKGFVISKLSPDAEPTQVPIDTSGGVYFHSATLPATSAMRIIAATDNANVQIASDVTGTVTFSSTEMSALKAADEIARQTHTRWVTYYAIAPRNTVARNRLGETVIGTTAGGQPITEDSSILFHDNIPQPPPPVAGTATATNSTGSQQTPTTIVNPYSPYNPYGYNPYAPYDLGVTNSGDLAPGISISGTSSSGVTVLPYSPYSGPLVFTGQ